jgi:hypothetical protein
MGTMAGASKSDNDMSGSAAVCCVVNVRCVTLRSDADVELLNNVKIAVMTIVTANPVDSAMRFRTAPPFVGRP